MEAAGHGEEAEGRECWCLSSPADQDPSPWLLLPIQVSLPGSANPVMKVSHWHARRLLSEGIPGPVTVAINMKTSQTMGSIDRQRDQYIGMQADRQTERDRQTDIRARWKASEIPEAS